LGYSKGDQGYTEGDQKENLRRGLNNSWIAIEKYYANQTIVECYSA
jgi:hypothetical protein